jgi:hypothetical protein
LPWAASEVRPFFDDKGEAEMMSKRQLLRMQRSWAVSRGLKPDTRGYLADVAANLFRPLSATTLAAFEEGGGSELKDRARAPAKMKALHSSAVLAVNFFDYWADRDCAPLLQALGIDEPSPGPLRFEAKLPTGLTGNPPNLDVLFELESGVLIGIESKFTEWLGRKRQGRELFKPKYFENGAELWVRNGLPRCQSLVADLVSGATMYRTLDVAQLLKHALGLAVNSAASFTLYYLYYDLPCPASKTHREELWAFAERVGAELRFEALTYQELFQRLSVSGRADQDYLAYLESRYFRPRASSPREAEGMNDDVVIE